MDVDGELGNLEKRVKKRGSRNVLIAVAVAEFATTVLMLAFFPVLSKVSVYGSSLLLSSVLCGCSQAVHQVATGNQSADSLAKFHVWGALLGIWTKFWTDELAYKFDNAFVKIFWDQVLGNPISVFTFTSLNAIWEGYSIDNYIQRNLKQAYKMSLILWPAASLIQFLVLKPAHVFLFNVLVNFAWNLILSYIS